jgi:hypothetical protein
MEIYPRGRMKSRLAIWGGLVVGVYVFLWWCTRSFTIPPGAKPQGEVVDLETRLRADIKELAGVTGIRDLWRIQALEHTRQWIVDRWTSQGLKPVEYAYKSHDHEFKNIEVDVAGDGPMILVGAHYDSAGTPGADDNGSGVAALLEITRQLAGAKLGKKLRCVAFTNEEPPFFDTDDMGSRVYAKMAAARGDKIEAMLSLETIAFFTDAPGSQKYPFGLGHFYPDTGNFIGIVGDLGSRALVERTAKLLGSATDVPVQCAALPGRLPGVFWSDHSSFWPYGVPAVMVTDTAPFRNRNYHQNSDLPETLDYGRFARVTAGLVTVTKQLCGAN